MKNAIIFVGMHTKRYGFAQAKKGFFAWPEQKIHNGGSRQEPLFDITLSIKLPHCHPLHWKKPLCGCDTTIWGSWHVQTLLWIYVPCGWNSETNFTFLAIPLYPPPRLYDWMSSVDKTHSLGEAPRDKHRKGSNNKHTGGTAQRNGGSFRKKTYRTVWLLSIMDGRVDSLIDR